MNKKRNFGVSRQELIIIQNQNNWSKTNKTEKWMIDSFSLKGRKNFRKSADIWIFNF